MNLKALTVALILGSSSAALASPSYAVQANANLQVSAYGRWSSGPVVRDHRTPRRTQLVTKLPVRDRVYPLEDAGWYEPRSTMLAPNITFAGATTRTINVGERAGSFTTLELEAVAGTPEIQQITVQYVGGTGQAFHGLNATLVPGRPLVLTLNTVPRAIERIIVYAPGYGNAKRTWSDVRDAEGAFRITAR